MQQTPFNDNPCILVSSQLRSNGIRLFLPVLVAAWVALGEKHIPIVIIFFPGQQ